jgi:hypothetical protein
MVGGDLSDGISWLTAGDVKTLVFWGGAGFPVLSILSVVRRMCLAALFRGSI